MKVIDSQGIVTFIGDLESGDLFRYHCDVYIISDEYIDHQRVSIRLSDGHYLPIGESMAVAKVGGVLNIGRYDA